MTWTILSSVAKDSLEAEPIKQKEGLTIELGVSNGRSDPQLFGLIRRIDHSVSQGQEPQKDLHVRVDVEFIFIKVFVLQFLKLIHANYKIPFTEI